MRKLIKIRIQLILLGLLVFNYNCKTIIKRKYSDCKVINQPKSPFIIYFEKDTIIGDSLFLNVSIYNNSDSVQIINMQPDISCRILHDTSLKPGLQVFGGRHLDIIYKYDQNSKQIVDCRNCFKYYSETLPYLALKKFESFTVKINRHYLRLSKKSKNYEIMLKVNWTIPSYLNAYCPKIWTGSIFAINKIRI